MSYKHGAFPCTNAQFFLSYLIPVSDLFRRKAFWFRGLGQKPGQRFVVCGGIVAWSTNTRARLVLSEKGLDHPPHTAGARLRSAVRGSGAARNGTVAAK